MRQVAAPFALCAIVMAGLATGAHAQDPGDCPPADRDGTSPIELRLGDHMVRAEVRSDTAEGGEGTRVAVRLVGCEVEKLLNDLRVAIELAPAEGEGCFRARFEMSDSARAGQEPAVGDRPLALQFCLPRISVGPASRPDAP